MKRKTLDTIRSIVATLWRDKFTIRNRVIVVEGAAMNAMAIANQVTVTLHGATNEERKHVRDVLWLRLFDEVSNDGELALLSVSVERI